MTAKDLLSWRLSIRNEGDRGRIIVLYSDTLERWIQIIRPFGFGRDEHGWWLSPLLRFHVNDPGQYEYADGHMVEIPFIFKDTGRDRSLHFHLIYFG